MPPAGRQSMNCLPDTAQLTSFLRGEIEMCLWHLQLRHNLALLALLARRRHILYTNATTCSPYSPGVARADFAFMLRISSKFSYNS